MKTLADYTKWMREQIALKVKEIDSYEVLDREDGAYQEGKVEAYKDVLSMLDSINYGRQA